MKSKIHTKFGTAKIDKKGYYYITSRKEGNNGKFLHRLVFEDFYKIKLPKDVFIHHNDGDKTNNEIWNLIPLSLAEHTALHNHQIEYTENRRTNISNSLSKTKNTSGFYRVSKMKTNKAKQGFTWVYRYYENGKRKSISNINIEKLREKVLSKGLEWKQFKEAIQ